MTASTNIQPFIDALSSDWEQALQHDEWFFSSLIEGTTSELSPHEAFDAIDELVALLISQRDSTLIYYCGVFLISLIRLSDTSEVPVVLRSSWDSVVSILDDSPDILQQLQEWYRRP
ncbi:hypothetical protein HW115_18820 [Verrucomicrobiaceae bacterium N1E253]|uniref:Uncharacterized protein n=1 Tax=Oceaniferula marina TaxID=2748318 RepID=A0A851GIP5_9BACT|nr:hypothetical protein [Oceaniferula marina]NWK57678.1 hypothetical protein [Oceaniferula marina]